MCVCLCLSVCMTDSYSANCHVNLLCVCVCSFRWCVSAVMLFRGVCVELLLGLQCSGSAVCSAGTPLHKKTEHSAFIPAGFTGAVPALPHLHVSSRSLMRSLTLSLTPSLTHLYISHILTVINMVINTHLHVCTVINTTFTVNNRKFNM